MCCGGFIAKYVLFFFNLACFVVGLIIFILGIVVITNVTDLVGVVPDDVNLNLIPIATIVFGSIVFLISFLGCWGAIRGNGCMLVTYAVIMLILAGLKTWLAVVIFQNLQDLQDTVNGWLNRAFADPNLTEPFNVMESSFKCCGTTGADSYGNRPLPGSCCGVAVEQACNASAAFEGCNALVSEYLGYYGEFVGAVVIAIIIIEVVAMIFALFLNYVNNNRRRTV